MYWNATFSVCYTNYQNYSYLCNRQVFVGSLVVWLVGGHLLLRNFGPYGIIVMNVFCYNRRCGDVMRVWALRDNVYECLFCYNYCHGNALKRFWDLWDIYTYVCILIWVSPSLFRDHLLSFK